MLFALWLNMHCKRFQQSLPPGVARAAVTTLSQAGIAGGAIYDGLVGLAAKAAGVPLLSCDRRAIGTYAALGVDVRLI